MAGKLTRSLSVLGLLVAMTAAWHWSSEYYLVLATRILIFAVFAMSLDLIVGYLGLPSLGHAAFYGTAGYAIGIIALNHTTSFAIDFLAAIGCAVGMGLVFNALALRTRGVYYLMLTLALAQVVWGIAFEWRSLTGGDDGLPGIPRPAIGPWSLSSTGDYYLFVAALFLICGGVMLLIVNSPFGLSLKGIHESPSRMSALGYNVWLHEFIASVIASLFAGVASALLAWQDGIMSPVQLNVITSGEALLAVILGGAGTIIGPFLGSTVIVLAEYLVSAATGRWESVLGGLYIVVVMFAPTGIYPLLRAGLAALFGVRLRPGERPRFIRPAARLAELQRALSMSPSELPAEATAPQPAQITEEPVRDVEEPAGFKGVVGEPDAAARAPDRQPGSPPSP